MDRSERLISSFLRVWMHLEVQKPIHLSGHPDSSFEIVILLICLWCVRWVRCVCRVSFVSLQLIYTTITNQSNSHNRFRSRKRCTRCDARDSSRSNETSKTSKLFLDSILTTGRYEKNPMLLCKGILYCKGLDDSIAGASRFHFRSTTQRRVKIFL